MQYFITKKKKKYYLFDSLAIEFGSYSLGCPYTKDSSLRIDKKDRLYCVTSFEVIDDYYCDIGAITHVEKVKEYLGTIIFRTNDLYELFNEYNKLIK